MRRLTFLALGKAEWREAPDAVLEGAAEALVRPLVIGRCDLDTAFLRGALPLPSGEPIGHEMIGEVLEAGDAVRGIRPGDRVIVPAQISCGLCRNCRRGFTGRCQAVPFGASYGMGREGGFGSLASDLVRVPFADAMLVPLPRDSDPVALISVADMATDAWRAVGPHLLERPGASVLVMGGRPAVIGLLSAGLAVAMGAARVVYADDDEERLAQARCFGAEAVRMPGNLGEPFEIVVDACVPAAWLKQAIRATEPEGVVTSVTLHLDAELPFPLLEMYHKGVFFRAGRVNCRPGIEPALHQCRHGNFKPELIKTTLVPYDLAPEAWPSNALRVAAAVPELLPQ